MYKKRTLTCVSLGLSFLLAVTAIGHSIALYTKDASQVGFKFGFVQKYYLVGTFNGWTTQDEYLFTDVTDEMSPETNKIAEYKISGVSLTKGETLKINDNLDNWYGGYGKYSHTWSNPVSLDGEDYVVPMTSTSYTVYLKLYSNDSYSIYLTARKNVLTFEASTDQWLKDGAVPRITINTSNDGTGKTNPGTTIINGTQKEGTTNQYIFTLTDTQYDSVLDGSGSSYFAYQRYSSTEGVWNGSSYMKLSNYDTNNAFRLYEGNWDGWGASNGAWWTE